MFVKKELINKVGNVLIELSLNIMEYAKGGKIKVYTQRDASGEISELIVVSEDNGAGLPSEPNALIRKSLMRTGTIHQGFGLSNIIFEPDRVKIEFKGRKWARFNNDKNASRWFDEKGESESTAGTKFTLEFDNEVEHRRRKNRRRGRDLAMLDKDDEDQRLTISKQLKSDYNRKDVAKKYNLDKEPKVAKAAQSVFGKAVPLDVVKGARVLDLATGTGLMAGIALQKGAREVVAVDNSSEMLKQAEKNLLKAGSADKFRLLEGDFLNLKELLRKEDGTLEKFDIITIANTLHYYPYEARKKILSQARELLSEDGYIVVLYRSMDEEHNAKYGKCSMAQEEYITLFKVLGISESGFYEANYETDEDHGLEIGDLEVIISKNMVVWAHNISCRRAMVDKLKQEHKLKKAVALVVDDDDKRRRIIASKLRQEWGFDKVYETSNQAQANVVIQENKSDLVLIIDNLQNQKLEIIDLLPGVAPTAILDIETADDTIQELLSSV
jgi:ubiquinone/menaquinone biosynthesis C-methylase UbiE